MTLHVDAAERAEQPAARGGWARRSWRAARSATDGFNATSLAGSREWFTLERSHREDIFDELARRPRVEVRRRLIEHQHRAADEQRDKDERLGRPLESACPVSPTSVSSPCGRCELMADRSLTAPAIPVANKISRRQLRQQ
jgi:hypothetical protein